VSGQPRKIEGMKSTKVWAIAMEAIKIIKKIGFIKENSVADKPIKIVPTRFI
jgi:hypothetical protein